MVYGQVYFLAKQKVYFSFFNFNYYKYKILKLKFHIIF